MPENAIIEQALDQVADRTPIDWDALERSLNSADERRWLDCVRVLEGIANFHLADGEDGAAAPGGAGAADVLTTQIAAGPAAAETVDTVQWWGRYRLDQRVGEGAFGCVYRAWDPELEREVAVKNADTDDQATGQCDKTDIRHDRSPRFKRNLIYAISGARAPGRCRPASAS